MKKTFLLVGIVSVSLLLASCGESPLSVDAAKELIRANASNSVNYSKRVYIIKITEASVTGDTYSQLALKPFIGDLKVGDVLDEGTEDLLTEAISYTIDEDYVDNIVGMYGQASGEPGVDFSYNFYSRNGGFNADITYISTSTSGGEEEEYMVTTTNTDVTTITCDKANCLLSMLITMSVEIYGTIEGVDISGKVTLSQLTSYVYS